MKLTSIIVLAGLLALPLAAGSIPGAAIGTGYWSHDDASSGEVFTCWGHAIVTVLPNSVPYGTLTVTFTFENRPTTSRTEVCSRAASAFMPQTMAWTDAREDANGQITATRADPCITRAITLTPGWSGSFHQFSVIQERPCLGPVRDEIWGTVD